MTPRCLKCGQSRTTNECEIKQRVEKPICINCNQVGHVAAYRGCAEFPKLTTAHKNRNNNFDSNKYLVNSNISYAQKASATRANTQDSEQQMSPPAHRPANNVNNQSAASASTCIESNVNNPPTPSISGSDDLSELMTALKELRKLMKEAPQLIAALQAMKYTNNTADKLQLLMHRRLVHQKTEQLDSIVCRLEDKIINAKISTSNPVKEDYIYHDSKLRELNSERNHARKTFQTYRDPVLKRKPNKLNKQINRLDQKIETDDFTNELLNVNATDDTVWKYVTPFKKKFKNIPSFYGPAGIANTDLEKANFLAESLETQFTLNNITNPDNEELVADSVMRFRTEANSVCKDFDPLLPSEVPDCIKSLRIIKPQASMEYIKKLLKICPYILF
ncbi:hypothetical protein AVEN_70307-1 [Araneus ventricosus]|uniref:Pre-C2HC domain-containing protein n=1 Tax=Araneus ventricosus TaxID=182803 RepID=A0A4Y2WNK6_ARAVE|nr:hypothetical protein AVEN_70307-1 [Araneus ventricosus]